MKQSYKKIIGALLAAQLICAAAVHAQPARGGIPPSPQSNPSNFNSDLYRVDKQLVESAGKVGEIARYRIHIDALGDIDQVRILENLPAGLAFVEVQPAPAESSGSARMWVFDNMARGTSQDIHVTVRPTQGGWFVTDTKVAVVPVVSLPIFAGEPRLELAKTGPSVAELNDNIIYELIVTNVGTATAADVIVSDTLPAGLYGPGRSTNIVTHKIGDLHAGESRVIKVPVKAAVKGEWDNRANAYSTQRVQADASVHVSIVESKLTLGKTGPAQAFIFGEITYVITGRNDGDTVLTNIALMDTLPAGVVFVRASEGGRQNGGQVDWTIPELMPGQQFTRTVTITTRTPMITDLTATATLMTGRRVSASVRTTWEGAPGVLTEIADDVDPVRVGGRIVYTVRITNQSPMRPLASGATLTFSPNIRVLEITKGVRATIDGQRVTIRDISLKPRGVLAFKITVEAVEAGMGDVRFEFGAGFLPRPVVKEETTYIY
jgi:uncharacterized repeat protein (TIGR01451 family)